MLRVLTDNEIPSDLQAAIEAAGVGEKFLQIVRKYPLHIDQQAGAWAAVTLLIRGGIKSEDLVRKMERLGYIDHETAIQIGQDINREILIPIRETLQKIQELAETHGAEAEGKESILRGISNPETIHRPAPPPPVEPRPTPVPVIRERDLAIPEPENMPAPTAVMERLSIQPTITAKAPIAPVPVTEAMRVPAQKSPSLAEEKLAGLTRMPRETTVTNGDPNRVIPEDLKARLNSDPYREPV